MHLEMASYHAVYVIFLTTAIIVDFPLVLHLVSFVRSFDTYMHACMHAFFC